MVGSIDPRCETLRGTHWPVKVAGVFGTRVAENHLGQRFKATASTGRTYGCKRSDQTLKNSCGTGAVHIWVPVIPGRAPARARKSRAATSGFLVRSFHSRPGMTVSLTMKLVLQLGLGALQAVALGFRQGLAGTVDIECQHRERGAIGARLAT